MNTPTRTLVFGAILAGLVLSIAPALAEARGGRGHRTPPSQEQRAEARAQMLEALDLSAEQKTQVDEVFVTLDAERKSLMDTARESGDRETMKETRGQMKELQEEADTQLKSILSEEQYARLVELRASQRSSRGGRGQRGGGRR
ncbi:hypothetical protein ACFL6X_02385 [Candidatus Latescibacterota bacterium]